MGDEARDRSSPPVCDRAQKFYEDLKWMQLTKGVRLTSYDAILICPSSYVTVRSNVPFGLRIDWEPHDGAFWASIGGPSVVGLSSPSGSDLVEVEVTDVFGEARYSQEKFLVLKHGLGFMSGARILSAEETAVHDQERRARKDALASMKWEPLSIWRILEPGDMIWTREGRVEIEFLRKQSVRLHDGGSDVTDETGRFTGKSRFHQQTYFILDPGLYPRAQVNKIIGEVWVARDRQQVREFLRRFQSPIGSFHSMDSDAYYDWHEMLKKKELE